MKVCQDSVLFICIQLWIIKESDCQEGYCPKYDPVVYFCTNSEVTKTSSAIIKTANVPKFQQTFCQCIIALSHHGNEFRLDFYGLYSKGMQFKINDIELDARLGIRTIYLTTETTLYLSTAENYTKEEACLLLYTRSSVCSSMILKFTFLTLSLLRTIIIALANSLEPDQMPSNSASDDRTLFNISCTKPERIITTTIIVTNTTTLVTSKDRATEGNVTASVTTADTTTDANKDNITTHPSRSSGGLDSSGKLTATVVPTVICALLILTVSVILLVYVKRRRVAKETRHHEQELHPTPALSETVTEQGQGQQNIASGEECGPNISVNPYERLNMYVNDNLAGETYQQLEVDKTEEYQEMHDVRNISGNQNRHFTKQTIFQEGKEQENNSNETSTNAYERLNMYVNDTLAGEMYQQLQDDNTGNVLGKSVPGKEVRTIVKSDRKTDTNENTFAVYTNAISQGDEYDDIA